ncbi:hypothetical protein HK103_001346 [Boothiomyces macroporosus]|uniref:Uncharacterized protein n=1 Tax=Boothiomyces macroporosus TaxID=261099 RepID=A0AAD5UE10_9FUNG|nr:hypothetical protein HK103_001346 [Boothiomyces macroporosus]
MADTQARKRFSFLKVIRELRLVPNDFWPTLYLKSYDNDYKIDQLLKLNTVRLKFPKIYIDFSLFHLTDDFLPKSFAMELVISDFDDSDFEGIDISPVTTLHVRKDPGDGKYEKLFQRFSHVKNLQSLKIRYRLWNGGSFPFEELPKLSISTLSLRYCNMSPEFIEKLTMFLPQTDIKELDLSCNNRDYVHLLSCLPLTKIEVLLIQHCAISRRPSEYLNKVLIDSSVKRFKFEKIRSPELYCELLCNLAHSKLECFEYDGPLGPKSFEYLSANLRLSCLRELTLCLDSVQLSSIVEQLTVSKITKLKLIIAKHDECDKLLGKYWKKLPLENLIIQVSSWHRANMSLANLLVNFRTPISQESMEETANAIRESKLRKLNLQHCTVPDGFLPLVKCLSTSKLDRLELFLARYDANLISQIIESVTPIRYLNIFLYFEIVPNETVHKRITGENIAITILNA